MIPQGLLQQRRRPNGRMRAEFPRVGLDDLGNQRIDPAVVGSRTTRTWGVRETFPQVEPRAFLEPVDPVVDGLTTDAQGFGDRLDRLALIEPEQHLGPTSLLGQGGVCDEILQIATLPSAEFERSHRPLLNEGRSSINSL